MQAIDRTQAPQIHDFTAFKPEKPLVSCLRNGILLKQFVNPQLDLLHFIIKIKAGRYYERKKKRGPFLLSPAQGKLFQAQQQRSG